MIPTFTLITTLVTIGVTALLISILVRINNPQRRAPADRSGGGDGGPVIADGAGSGRASRQDQDTDGADSDSGGDGGGD